MKNKPQQILVIHGGTTFDSYKEYMEYLNAREASLERMQRIDWKENLGKALGDKYHVINPKMPNSWDANYTEWKIWFEKIVQVLNHDIILVGHSLGGIFLAKYLSENKCKANILAIFLVSAPYKETEDESLGNFLLSTNLKKLAKQGGKIFIYHSEDDPVVSFADSGEYMKEIPGAILRKFADRGHFNQDKFPEIVADIKKV